MKSLIAISSTVFLCSSATLAFAQGGPKVNETVFRTESIKGVAAVTKVFGRSQNMVAAIIEFAEPVSATAAKPELFSVDNRKITSVKVTATPDIDAAAGDGRFVVIELDPADKAAVVYGADLDEAPQLVANLVAPLALVSGKAAVPGEKAVISTRVNNLIVDDFRQFRFTDPVTGLLLDYNLYIPKDYDPKQTYPMVMFMHDAGVTGSNPRRTLQQGLGAVSFASPQDQAKHPSFVLAPQFPVSLSNDKSQTSIYVDIIPRLIEQLTKDFAVDKKRLYTTGQSGGCMTSIALGISNPNLFAGTLCVAGQWDPSLVAPLAEDNLWVLVSEDDAKAFPGMTSIMETLAAKGANIARGSIDAKAAPEVQAQSVADIRSSGKGSNVFFTTFTKGSVLPEGDTSPGAGHVNTWVYAYDIPAIRDWLFEQKRD